MSDIYKQGTRDGVRFQSEKGDLTIEQLWTLNPKQLDKIAVDLEDEIGKTKRKTFLETTPSTSKNELKLKIVLDILETKVKENKEALEVRDKKEKIENLQALIQAKKEENQKSKTIEELEAELEDLTK